MSFFDLVRKRFSVRSYLEKPVERDKIERCLEAARLAPSACNAQPWKFIVADDPELKTKIAGATFGKVLSFNHFSLKVPVFIIIIAEPPNITSGIGAVVKNIPYYMIDIGIAAEHFCLQAVEEGLGTCMIGWFNEKEIKKLLKVPPGKKVALLIALGYPDSDKIPEKVRKDIGKIKSFNKY